MNKRLLVGIVLAATVVAVGILSLRGAPAPQTPTSSSGNVSTVPATASTVSASVITWSVPQLSATLFPGASTTTTLTFRSSQNLPAVTVWITPSLNGIVSASPATFASIAANQDYQIMLQLSLPPLFQSQAFTGTIHIRNADGNKRTYDIPLAVTLTPGFTIVSQAQSGLSFTVPVPIGYAATRLTPQAPGLYIAPPSEEEGGGGVSVRLLTGPMSAVLVDPSFTLINQASKAVNGRTCVFVTEREPDSGLQFYNAFIPTSGGSVMVGGSDTPDNEVIVNSIVAGLNP